MTSFSAGCVLPVGPRFEDPPATENVPPYITSTNPVQGQILGAVNKQATLGVSFTDLNADGLFLRWLTEYPQFSSTNTHLLLDDTVPAPANHQPAVTSRTVQVSCFNALALTNQHTITVFISDQPFWDLTDPDAPTNPEDLLTHNKANSVMAQANWVLNLPCP